MEINSLNENVENVKGLARLASKLRKALGGIFRPLRHLVTVNFWLVVLLLVNIAFFLGSFFEPIKDRYVEMTSFAGASQELMGSIKEIEETTGVEMSDFVDKSYDAFSTLNQNIIQANLRSERIEAALVAPQLILKADQLPDDEIDCLGTLETILRERGSTEITSHRGARVASFEGALGFAHTVAVVCLENSYTIVGTGYNVAGTSEIVEDVTRSAEAIWKPEPETESNFGNCINC